RVVHLPLSVSALPDVAGLRCAERRCVVRAAGQIEYAVAGGDNAQRDAVYGSGARVGVEDAERRRRDGCATLGIRLPPCTGAAANDTRGGGIGGASQST